MIWSILTMWQFLKLFLMFLPMTRHKYTSQIPDIRFYRYFLRSGMGVVGEACLPSNAYYSRTPDYTLYSRVHVCWSEHSDSSFVYGFMSLDYGLGTMTAISFYYCFNFLSAKYRKKKSVIFVLISVLFLLF